VDRGKWTRVVWWSFYDDYNFETFLKETLEYLKVDVPQSARLQADALLREAQEPTEEQEIPAPPQILEESPDALRRPHSRGAHDCGGRYHGRTLEREPRGRNGDFS
jgi:hypothetical protein